MTSHVPYDCVSKLTITTRVDVCCFVELGVQAKGNRNTKEDPIDFRENLNERFT